MIPLRWGLKPETSQVKSCLSTWKIGCCVFLFEPDFGTEFLTPEKSKWRVSYRHVCFQISTGIPHLPGALPSFAALMAFNNSLNSCFSSRHAMFTVQQIELCQETRRRNRSARHQYMHFLGITASLLHLRPLLGLL